MLHRDVLSLNPPVEFEDLHGVLNGECPSSGVRGINALIGTVTTKQAAPFIAGARRRKGAANSARGAGKFTSDLLATVARLRSTGAAGVVLLRSDSAFYADAVAAAAARAGPGRRSP